MMRTRTYISLLSIILGVFLIGCDPYHSITVTNVTADTVSIFVKPTIHFRTDNAKSLTTSDGFDIYKLSPNEQMHVGSAIAEIDNDIPFEFVKIVSSRDTVTASALDDIKNLFDKKTSGGLKTPYNLTIK